MKKGVLLFLHRRRRRHLLFSSTNSSYMYASLFLVIFCSPYPSSTTSFSTPSLSTPCLILVFFMGVSKMEEGIHFCKRIDGAAWDLYFRIICRSFCTVDAWLRGRRKDRQVLYRG